MLSKCNDEIMGQRHRAALLQLDMNDNGVDISKMKARGALFFGMPASMAILVPLLSEGAM